MSFTDFRSVVRINDCLTSELRITPLKFSSHCLLLPIFVILLVEYLKFISTHVEHSYLEEGGLTKKVDCRTTLFLGDSLTRQQYLYGASKLLKIEDQWNTSKDFWLGNPFNFAMPRVLSERERIIDNIASCRVDKFPGVNMCRTAKVCELGEFRYVPNISYESTDQVKSCITVAFISLFKPFCRQYRKRIDDVTELGKIDRIFVNSHAWVCYWGIKSGYWGDSKAQLGKIRASTNKLRKKVAMDRLFHRDMSQLCSHIQHTFPKALVTLLDYEFLLSAPKLRGNKMCQENLRKIVKTLPCFKNRTRVHIGAISEEEDDVFLEDGIHLQAGAVAKVFELISPFESAR